MDATEAAETRAPYRNTHTSVTIHQDEKTGLLAVSLYTYDLTITIGGIPQPPEHCETEVDVDVVAGTVSCTVLAEADLRRRREETMYETDEELERDAKRSAEKLAARRAEREAKAAPK